MKNKFTYFSLFCITLLTACGGGDNTSEPSTPEPLASPPTGINTTFSGTGEISLPANSNTFNGNLLLQVEASDPIGLTQVALEFSNASESKILCNSAQECGTDYSETISGINPGEFGATPGQIQVTLILTDTQGLAATASTLSINWQPPVINNVVVTRSATGTEISVNWDENTSLLRYNVYMASQTGVNRSNYIVLPDGRAQLAVTQGPVVFTGVNPNTNYFILLTGIDGSGESTNLSEIQVPPTGVNPNTNPVANDDVASVDEDDVILINALSNDTDADGDTLSIETVTATTGTASVLANEIEYVPPQNFNGTSTLNYSISDGRGGSDNAQITVTVNSVNDEPVAVDDFATTLQNTDVNIDVLANDLDIDGDSLTVTNVVFGSGTGTIETDNTVTFSPDVNFTGTDFFDYTIEDGNGGASTATVEIDIGLVSRPPIANPDSYVGFVEETLNIDATQGLLVNDADPDGDEISVVIPASDPSSGTFTVSPDGSFTYTPATSFVGTDTFTYQIVADNGQTRSSTVSIDIRIVPEDLAGDSTSISGEFLYIGQGEFEPGTGRGSGLYRIGDCLQDTNTLCSMQGEYIEAAVSGSNPGQTGRYALIQRYAGNGNSPLLAVSRTAGSNVLSFSSLGGTSFDLYLFPNNGGIIRGAFPDDPFANSINFGAFIDTGAVCAGLPGGTPCSIGQVGLVNGAQISADLDRLNFSQPGKSFDVDNNRSPQAQLDSYTTTINTRLVVNAPGVLTNDTDPDTPAIGEDLQIASQFSPGIGGLTAIGFDEYSQQIYSAANLGPTIQIHDRIANPIRSIPMLGELTENVDIEIAPRAFQLAGNSIPQGTLLLINGQTGPAEIYAFDPINDVLIAQLNTSFGNGNVVGGAYNPITGTFFLLQNNSASTNEPVIAEINTNTGAIINQFDAAFAALDYDVGFGDLDVNNQTGMLYVISSEERGIFEFTANGSIVRELTLPTAIDLASGIAVSEDVERIWVSSQDGNVYELAYPNQGVAPQLRAFSVVTTENGTLITGNDGSFIYTPNTGFVGEDVFTYEIRDGKGKNSLNNVRINVTN